MDSECIYVYDFERFSKKKKQRSCSLCSLCSQNTQPRIVNMVGETQGTNGSSIRYLDTEATYDLWAQQYDTDGNFLTALDSEEMKTLLPTFLSMVKTPKPWKIVDLGCGTGRNTVQLLGHPEIDVVVALDLSPKMLEIAKDRIKSTDPEAIVLFEVYDMLRAPSPPPAALGATAVISTLVVEHIPLPEFFKTVSTILGPGGLLLLTNMHSEMGSLTQAGFMDPETGEKVRPVSYAHSMDDILLEAETRGFEVILPLAETKLTEQDVEAYGQRAAKYVGVRVWYGGILRKQT